MGEIAVRKAKASDIKGVAELALKLVKSHVKFDRLLYGLDPSAKKQYQAYFKKNLKKRNFILVVAESDQKLAGYALAGIEKRPPIYKTKKSCMLFDLFVEKRFRRKGASRQLFQKVLEFAKARKAKALQLKTDEKNSQAIKIYKKFGFKEHTKTMSMDV
jgi:ribosomal protein S18 acetylase RimI-like enzyme